MLWLLQGFSSTPAGGFEILLVVGMVLAWGHGHIVVAWFFAAQDAGCAAGRNERMGVILDLDLDLDLDVDVDFEGLTSFHTLFLPPDDRDRETADSKIINRAMPVSAFIPLGSRVFVRAAVLGKSSYAVLLGCSLHRRVPIWAALSFFNDISRLCKRDDRRSESAAKTSTRSRQLETDGVLQTSQKLS